MSNSKQINDDSELDYKQLISRIENKTTQKVNEIFNDSKLNSWLQDNQGSTYARILVKFKPIAERRFRSEYLQQALEDRVGILLSAKTRLNKRIGNLTAVLKPLEGGKLSWLLSPISLCIEWLLKAGLAVIPIMSIILILDNRPLPQILGEPNFFTYLAILAGVALVWLISASAYNWVVSIPSSRVLQNYWSKFELTKEREKPKNSQRKYSRQSYTFKISQFSILIVIICVIEAYIGYSIISHLLELIKYKSDWDEGLQSASIKGINFDKSKIGSPPKLNSLSLFLSASIFALTNLLFSVSKANRYNQIQKTKRRLEALRNQLNHLDQEIEHCRREVEKVKKDFDKDKSEYDELFNKEESGILNEIRLLSKQAYVNPPQPIKKYYESELKSLTDILQYSEDLTKINIDAFLNEEQQRSVLSVRDNLLFLASKVAEKEFELKARYIVKNTELKEDLDKIQERIKNIKDKPEVKSVREEFRSKGVIREYEMALESIKIVIQEAMEVVKSNEKESKKMHELLKPLTMMAERLESRGEAAWSQTDLGSVTEIFANIGKIFINMENKTVNEQQQTSYTQNINNPTQTGIAQGPNSTGIGTKIINQTTSEIQEITKTLRQQIQNLGTETSDLATVHLDVIDAEIVSSEQNPSAKVKAALKALWDLVKEITPVASQVLEIAGKLGLATLIG